MNENFEVVAYEPKLKPERSRYVDEIIERFEQMDAHCICIKKDYDGVELDRRNRERVSSFRCLLSGHIKGKRKLKVTQDNWRIYLIKKGK